MAVLGVRVVVIDLAVGCLRSPAVGHVADLGVDFVVAGRMVGLADLAVGCVKSLDVADLSVDCVEIGLAIDWIGSLAVDYIVVGLAVGGHVIGVAVGHVAVD